MVRPDAKETMAVRCFGLETARPPWRAFRKATIKDWCWETRKFKFATNFRDTCVWVNTLILSQNTLAMTTVSRHYLVDRIEFSRIWFKSLNCQIRIALRNFGCKKLLFLLKTTSVLSFGYLPLRILRVRRIDSGKAQRIGNRISPCKMLNDLSQ